MNWTKLTKRELAGYLDFSILPKDTQEAEIREGCRLAKQYQFAAFYASSAYWAPVIREELGDAVATIEVGTGIAFPFGVAPAAVKAFEVEDAVRRGCTTVDMVLNVGALKDRRHAVIEEELRLFAAAAAGRAVTKAILEVCFLTDEEIAAACRMIMAAGIAYAKTSTGQFEGPSLEQVLLMKNTLHGSGVQLKVAGVKFPRPQNALAFLVAGATRIGTRAAPEIVEAWDTLVQAGLVPDK